MKNAASSPPAPAEDAELEPVWDIAYLFPPQGSWTEEEYLAFDQGASRRLEFTDGYIEVLPVPTELHQLLLLYFYEALSAFVRPRKLGLVLTSGLRIRLRPGQIREPDVVFMRADNAARRSNKFWEGADLVMEVVSDRPEDRERDLERKPREYAAAGIPEYWILDPTMNRILVLTLAGDRYLTHGEFRPGERATSVLLEGFSLDVTAALRGDLDSL